MNDFNKIKSLKFNIDLVNQIGLKESIIVEYIKLCCEINKNKKKTIKTVITGCITHLIVF